MTSTGGNSMTKKKLSDYLRTDLIYTKADFQSQEEVFRTIASDAEQAELVLPGFFQGLTDREKEFPTGIPLQKFGAAIPHTEADLVSKEFVAIVVNQCPIDFKSMEDNQMIVPTKIIFVLGLNEPHTQLEMLQSLMGLLQNDELLVALIAAQDSHELLTIIKQKHL